MMIAIALIIAITLFIGIIAVIYGVSGEDDVLFFVIGVALICISLVAVFELEELQQTPLNETQALNLTESWECVEWEEKIIGTIINCWDTSNVDISNWNISDLKNIDIPGCKTENYIEGVCTKYMKVGVRVI